MNTKILAVLAVIVVALSAWLLVASLQPSDAVQTGETEAQVSETLYEEKAPATATTGTAQVDTSVEVVDGNVETSVKIK